MRAVIFDIDGTLLESAAVDDRLYRAAVQRVLGRVNFRPRLDDYEHVSDSGILAEVLADNGIPREPDPAPDVLAAFLESLRRHVEMNGPFTEIPGARAFLDGLRSSPANYVALATGGWQASAELKLRSAGFDLAGLMLSASDSERDRTRIMRAALDRPQATFESITYFGDGPWDRAACERLGWRFVAVGAGLGGIRSFENLY